MPFELKINNVVKTVDVDPDTPLLWVLRDTLDLHGTKYGCGMGLCGACTVHVNGQATRSSLTQVSAVTGKTITTIEGLSPDCSHPVQRAWETMGQPYRVCASAVVKTTVSWKTLALNGSVAAASVKNRGIVSVSFS
jgi:isoquinoline 1-oxidoreductase subunit alpha